MVVGFRDHAVEIEENGFQRHDCVMNPPISMNGEVEQSHYLESSGEPSNH